MVGVGEVVLVQFGDDCCQCFGWVGGLVDWLVDYQVIGVGVQGLVWGEDVLLVVLGVVGWVDVWCDQLQVWMGGFQCWCFLG